MKIRLAINNYILLIPFVVMVFFDLVFALQLDGVSQSDWALIVRLQGVFSGGLFIALLPFIKTRIRQVSFEKYFAALSFVGIIYFTIHLLFSLIVNSAYYAIGDYYRAVIPFMTLFVLNFVYNTIRKKRQFLRVSFVILLSYELLRIIGKIYVYNLNGRFYGGGINQYSISVFLLAFCLLYVLHKSIYIKRFVILTIVIVLVAISILSLKRMNWAIMLITFFSIFVITHKKVLFIGIVGIFLFAGFIFLQGNQRMLNAVEQRIEKTYSSSNSSGERTFDSSSMERFKELKGALHTMSLKGIGAYLFGTGHGGEFVSDPEYPFRLSAAGSKIGHFHHIHSMYALVFFRYGFIGILLICALVLPALNFLVRITFKRRGVTKRYNFVKFIAICSSLHLSIELFRGISSNIIYGDFIYSFYIFIFLCAISVLNENLEKSPRIIIQESV